MLSPIAAPDAQLVASAADARRKRGLRFLQASLFAACAGALVGCTAEGEGRPDSELGNLVISQTTELAAIDVDRATRDADALLEAVLRPHSWVSESLGAHRVNATSSVEVREGGEVVNELSDVLVIDIDTEGRFAATLDTNNEYGRHAIFDGTHLYLRPRYGLYHKRVPQTETEAGEIRTEMAHGAADYLELLAPGLEVTDQGAQTRDGRAVRRIGLALASKPRSLPKDARTQKAWRESIVVKTLSGQVELDAQTGAAVHLEVDGSVSFTRDGRSFQMRVQAKRTVEDIGHARTISAPSEEESMPIPARRRELDERNTLLRNIAPPARRAPTPQGAP